METILSFLLIGWVFWTLLAVLGIFVIINHERENLGWSHTIFILICTYALWKFGNLNIPYFTEHWAELLFYLCIYLGIGIVWSMFKWFFYLRSLRKEFDEAKQKTKLKEADCIKNNPKHLNEYGDDPNNRIYSFNSALCYELIYSNAKELVSPKYINIDIDKNRNKTKSVIESFEITPPLAVNYKAKILSWISHWPISVLWFMINDPIKKFINYVFELIKGVYQNISNRLFKDMLSDINVKQS